MRFSCVFPLPFFYILKQFGCLGLFLGQYFSQYIIVILWSNISQSEAVIQESLCQVEKAK